MKLIHGALSGLLAEVKEHGKVDGVRVALVMQSTVEGTGVLRYASWIVVTTPLDWERWGEWRWLVGRQRAELTEAGYQVPARLAMLAQERFDEVRGWIETAGLVPREGLLAADTESMEGVLG